MYYLVGECAIGVSTVELLAIDFDKSSVQPTVCLFDNPRPCIYLNRIVN